MEIGRASLLWLVSSLRDAEFTCSEDHETTAGQSNARKRTAESDTDRDGDAAKRVKET